MSDFNWYTGDADSVVIHPVAAVAVYTNSRGEVVIRQQDAASGEDAVIVIPKDRVRNLVVALRQAAKGGADQ